MKYSMRFLMKAGDLKERNKELAEIVEGLWEEITIGIHYESLNYILAIDNDQFQYQIIDKIISKLKELQ